MQTLYSCTAADGSITREQATRTLEQHLDQGRQLFVFLIHFITEIARYAETDSRQKASKHLPTASDLNVNTKIAGNDLLWRILEQPSYQQVVKELKPELLVNMDWVRKLYHELAETEIYKIYICLLYTSPSPRDLSTSRMPSSA